MQPVVLAARYRARFVTLPSDRDIERAEAVVHRRRQRVEVRQVRT